MGLTNFPGGVSSMGVPVIGGGQTFFGRYLFVDGNRGSDGNRGLDRDKPFGTMAKAFDAAESGDVIIFRGNITENLTAPAGVFDVTILGATPRPRHADAHTGYGGYSAATWKASSQSDPLLTLSQQGWVIGNVLFDCPTSDAAINFVRNASSGDAERDSSHAAIIGCRFAAGQEAIRITGTENVFGVLVEGNTFNDLTHAIVSSGGFAHRWKIRKNTFETNTNHIDVGFVQSLIEKNAFGTFTTLSLDLTGGANNMVYKNAMSGDYDTAEGYISGTDDTWVGNYAMLTTGSPSGDGAINVVPTS